jgi:hypothetical protein
MRKVDVLKSEPYLHTTDALCLSVRHTYFQILIAQLLILFASSRKLSNFSDACI